MQKVSFSALLSSARSSVNFVPPKIHFADSFKRMKEQLKIFYVLPDLEELCFFTKFTFARISCLIACASFHFALIQNPDWQMNVSKGSFLKNKLSNLKRFDEILKV